MIKTLALPALDTLISPVFASSSYAFRSPALLKSALKALTLPDSFASPALLMEISSLSASSARVRSTGTAHFNIELIGDQGIVSVHVSCTGNIDGVKFFVFNVYLLCLGVADVFIAVYFQFAVHYFGLNIIHKIFIGFHGQRFTFSLRDDGINPGGDFQS